MDQDRYSFRADATIGRFPFATTYRIEFGDFPGKYSERQSIEDIHSLYNAEFFKWVADSDSLMFAVDLGKYLSSKKNDFIAEVTSTFRAEWQKYLDVNSYRLKEVKRHPVVINFTKTDLLYRSTTQINQNSKEISDVDDLARFEKTIAQFGFSGETPSIIDLDENKVKTDTKKIEEDFAEIIKFFESEAPNTSVIFTSSFGFAKGTKLGFEKIFDSVLKGVK